MRAFDREIVDAVWETIAPILPRPVDNHPKRGHRPRIEDRIIFHGILVREATGCSWVDAEALIDWAASDTTMRGRRDEWIAAGVFAELFEHALAAYDRIIGLDLTEVAVDGSLHKAPCGGQGTGPNPTDRGRSGHKWSVATDAVGIPLGWALDGANRNDIPLLEPTLDHVASLGLHLDIETIHLDKGYDAQRVREAIINYGIDDAVIDRRRKPGEPKADSPPAKRGTHTLGLRWPVERTNSWLSNFGQLRRNTDRKIAHRNAQFCLAVVFLLTAKLVDWRDRWDPRT